MLSHLEVWWQYKNNSLGQIYPIRYQFQLWKYMNNTWINLSNHIIGVSELFSLSIIAIHTRYDVLNGWSRWLLYLIHAKISSLFIMEQILWNAESRSSILYTDLFLHLYVGTLTFCSYDFLGCHEAIHDHAATWLCGCDTYFHCLLRA